MNIAAVQSHNLARDVEAKTNTDSAAVKLDERDENKVLLSIADTDPCIYHVNQKP